MMDNQFLFSSTTSSLFDTYLIYGIVGLLILIAIIGLIVLLATSCCCCYCCLSPTSRCFCCFHNRRHSSYKLSQKSKQSRRLASGDSKKIAFIRRHPSDIADFSQLYDSCPHLINSKAMTTNMETSCTTIDTLVSPVSACSSFRSFIESGTLPKDITKPATVQNDLSNLIQQNNINVDKANIASSSSTKGAFSRPFSYIKNTNDRTQILRRFTSHERPVPPPAVVSIDIKRTSSSDNGNNNQTNSTCTNIYETVLPTPNVTSTSDVSVPIYETEWTHNLRQLIMTTSTTTPSIGNEGISVIELPPAPPDLVPSTQQPDDYFQQENPYDRFLAGRSTTSDSMRRANMLRRLKDDAAFLY